MAKADIEANHMINREVKEEIDLMIDLEAEQMQRYLISVSNDKNRQ